MFKITAAEHFEIVNFTVDSSLSLFSDGCLAQQSQLLQRTACRNVLCKLLAGVCSVAYVDEQVCNAMQLLKYLREVQLGSVPWNGCSEFGSTHGEVF
jgi:hypothetical protein